MSPAPPSSALTFRWRLALGDYYAERHHCRAGAPDSRRHVSRETNDATGSRRPGALRKPSCQGDAFAGPAESDTNTETRIRREQAQRRERFGGGQRSRRRWPPHCDSPEREHPRRRDACAQSADRLRPARWVTVIQEPVSWAAWTLVVAARGRRHPSTGEGQTCGGQLPPLRSRRVAQSGDRGHPPSQRRARAFFGCALRAPADTTSTAANKAASFVGRSSRRKGFTRNQGGTSGCEGPMSPRSNRYKRPLFGA